MITQAQWQVYKNIINKAHHHFNKQVVIWHRYTGRFQRFGEDQPLDNTFTDINLDSLIAYNVFRTWPVTKETSSGSVDKESATIILNKKYLEDLGYLNAAGFFNMDPGRDEFTINGIRYRPSGEIEVSQAYDEPLLFYIILIRKKTETTETKY